MIEISVVVPILNEEGSLRLLNGALCRVLEESGKKFEVVFVDDGSTDSSFAILSQLAQHDHRLKVIKFTKNFGQTPAIAAGVRYAQGRIIILMDGDLQNDPADIPGLLYKLDDGFDVASGWRRKRQDPFLSKRIPSYLANKLISLLTGIKLHDFGCTFKAYRSEVIKEIRLQGEMHRFLPVFAVRAGYRVSEVEVAHSKRSQGKSKYGLNRILKVLLDLPGLVFLHNYSIRPNYIFGGWGLFLIFIAILFFLGAVLFHILRGILLSGIILAIGIQLVILGLVIEMFTRVYNDITSKQPYIIKTLINF